MVSSCTAAPRAASVTSSDSLSDFIRGLSFEQVRAEFKKEVEPFGSESTGRRPVDFCVDEKLILSAFPKTPHYPPDDFLDCVTGNEVDLILMLNEVGEELSHYLNGTRCYEVTQRDVNKIDNFSISKVEVVHKYGNRPKKIVDHVQYLGWKDGWVIEACDIVKLARLAMAARKPLIHCFAGLGRTGVVAATVSAYLKIQGGDTQPDVIKRAVQELRTKRPGSVQHSPQYAGVYAAVWRFLEEDRLKKGC